MDYKYYIGVDVSKYTLDFTVLHEGRYLMHEKVTNSQKDIQTWLKKMMVTYKAGGKKTLFCVENSGLYTALLQRELVRRKVPLWMEAPLQIKLSMGLQRGKNDKIDSRRIAHHAYTNRQKAILWQQPREVIEYLKKLRSVRERLIMAQNTLKQELREMKGFVKRTINDNLSSHCDRSITALKEDLKLVNQTISSTIAEDDRLDQLFGWLTSVDGIGTVLATEMIIATNEFKSFTSPKKFACHCGVAPFRYTSGVSLQGKAKVSKQANQRMKRLLHIAAIAIIQREGDCRAYYQRRIKQGLSKMSVLNAVRNKIIHRAFACVRDQRPYVK
ncbi:transposase [Flavisolibacter nicotianae]|uniref:transposase n=1 Tax=Flavisolibacter nicotianae TaxID=2364882 RepID=UPI000EB5CD87|nr:transposase [Flavisolibacter nicotianae]